MTLVASDGQTTTVETTVPRVQDRSWVEADTGKQRHHVEVYGKRTVRLDVPSRDIVRHGR